MAADTPRRSRSRLASHLPPSGQAMQTLKSAPPGRHVARAPRPPRPPIAQTPRPAWPVPLQLPTHHDAADVSVAPRPSDPAEMHAALVPRPIRTAAPPAVAVAVARHHADTMTAAAAAAAAASASMLAAMREHGRSGGTDPRDAWSDRTMAAAGTAPRRAHPYRRLGAAESRAEPRQSPPRASPPPFLVPSPSPYRGDGAPEISTPMSTMDPLTGAPASLWYHSGQATPVDAGAMHHAPVTRVNDNPQGAWLEARPGRSHPDLPTPAHPRPPRPPRSQPPPLLSHVHDRGAPPPPREDLATDAASVPISETTQILPLAHVHRIMAAAESDLMLLALAEAEAEADADADVDAVLRAAPARVVMTPAASALVAKACELFIGDLTRHGWNARVGTQPPPATPGQSVRRLTIRPPDLAAAVAAADRFDFLQDLLPADGEGGANTDADGEADGLRDASQAAWAAAAAMVAEDGGDHGDHEQDLADADAVTFPSINDFSPATLAELVRKMPASGANGDGEDEDDGARATAAAASESAPLWSDATASEAIISRQVLQDPRMQARIIEACENHIRELLHQVAAAQQHRHSDEHDDATEGDDDPHRPAWPPHHAHDGEMASLSHSPS
ncbi:hypothetical protein CXG81DRAFT_26762 [Caulochytrium protostelioides]|uniref:Transcription factor CBF/NF-Y/archaeal histone domain-containing protein n=1 Tax=Caulochytrium protostelioides TaxID=1555241 RepID=A0A4P9X5V5_9FUNG|nr:hypothetical protein CXG81DRAFT_26762 [Caulochytrium protostelioides]|eukprot:RKP00533.1 hypothetical protein CXG81DRAFT_26762 [Caulochytrium protostelioides]